MAASDNDVGLGPTLIVEDDAATRARLRRLLAEVGGGNAVVATACSLAAARRHLQDHAAATALVDIGLPDRSGIELIAWLREHLPRTTAVVVSAWGEEETVLAALRAGATGYLLKQGEDVELLLALRSIARGGAPIDPFVARRILGLLSAPGGAARERDEDPQTAGTMLSGREREILDLVARGFSNREIARITGLSRFTIEDHTKSIYRKLAVGSRTAAVFEARTMGLLR